jgi:[protein-PII] uridylyltransferase
MGLGDINSTGEDLFSETKTGEIPRPEEVKKILAKAEERFMEAHQQNGSGVSVVREYTLLVDRLLTDLFARLSIKYKIKDSVALIALGGYGRSELNMRSDVDLMLVYKKKITPKVKELTENMLYTLWDAGLDVGFSIRSVKESITLAKEDLKTLTALLDTRLITGDASLLKELDKAVYSKLLSSGRASTFIEEKRAENKTRHERFGGTVYILEPNVKEGLGGLRDIHTARWIVQAKKLKKDIDLVADGLLTAEEAGELEASFDFILWIRNELHLLTQRKTEQLNFDHQVHISHMTGLKDTDRALAVEEFMQTYYGHASNIIRLSDLIIARALGVRKKGLFSKRTKKKIDDDFSLVDDLISVNSDKVFSDDPGKIMLLFEHFQKLSKEIDSFTCDQVIKNLKNFKGSHRKSKSVAQSFINILKAKKTFKTLETMHNLRFLETYIPEFKAIKFKVQHDLYHVYTVDVHTLFAVRELDRLLSVHKKDFFLYSTLYEELKRPELLILGVLFHDIGKALGKGHAVTGAEMVPKILGRMGIDDEGIELVRFLVRYHLILADTAQYRDFQDEKLMVEFARDVGSIKKLNMLFLLTFADVRAVGPEVWSKWKGTLFQDFYFRALKVLERGSFEVGDLDETISRIKSEVKLYLKEADEESLEKYLRLLPPRYFLANSPDMIANHMSLVDDLKDSAQVMRTIQNTEGAFTEIIICAHDVFGLFSMISGVMAANSINILDAHIYTLQNGIVIDILQVRSPLGELLTDKEKLKKIEDELSSVITGKVRVEKLVERKRPSILDQKSTPGVPTRIEIDNETSETYTIIDIRTQDRIGLLYNISKVLTDLGAYIVVAKITTKGEAAADIFYVNDIFGQKIYFDQKLKEIVNTLYDALEIGADDVEKATN